MTKKKNLLTESEVDRISNLPAHLIQLILTSLPIREAGKTSILSRQWRHHWRNITHLVFDDEFDQLEDFDSESEVSKLVTRVQQALQVHDGPITEFVLSVAGLTAAADTDNLISYISNKGISTLSLLFDLDPHSYGEEISSSLFRALQLVTLKLQGCELKVPSWFLGFTRLTVLELEQVCLPDDFFQSFLLKCPLLEDLRAYFFVGPSKLEVVGVPRLKVCVVRVYLVETISFNCTPLLSLVSIQAEVSASNRNDVHAVYIVSTFASLPALQQLNLSFECLQLLAAGPIPDRLPTALHRLEVLDIGSRHHNDHLLELGVLLCLIRSSPNLYKLTIQMKTQGLHPLNVERELIQLDSESDGYPGIEAEGDCCQRLAEVNVQDCTGSQVELDLLRFVLTNAPRLSRIVIKPEYQLCWGECLEFLEEVRQCDSVSKEAEVIYVNMSDVIIFRMKLATL